MEIQQSSDITYRLYDYGRMVDGVTRPLHLKQAIDVIKCPSPLESDIVIAASKRPVNKMHELVSCDYYTVWEVSISGEMVISQDYPFLIVCVVAGEGFIDAKRIHEGDHFILPCGYGEAKLCGEMRMILAVGTKKNNSGIS